MIHAYFDGACEPENPGGHGAAGWLVKSAGGSVIASGSKYLGQERFMTNNRAEYAALLEALRWLFQNVARDSAITCLGDSKLVIMQMWGGWRIQKGAYVETAQRCRKALGYFPNMNGRWIPREENAEADALTIAELRRHGIERRKR